MNLRLIASWTLLAAMAGYAAIAAPQEAAKPAEPRKEVLRIQKVAWANDDSGAALTWTAIEGTEDDSGDNFKATSDAVKFSLDMDSDTLTVDGETYSLNDSDAVAARYGELLAELFQISMPAFDHSGDPGKTARR